MKKLNLFVLFLVLFLSGCISSNKTGNFQIYLTDQPIDSAEQISVTLSEISVQKEGAAFFTVWSGEETYDLLKLRDKEEKIIDVSLDEGTYTQIRLVVTEGQIVIAGESNEMVVPSSEVMIPLIFDINEGGATEIVLDFEAEHSIQVVSAGQSEQYILKPVVKVKSISY